MFICRIRFISVEDDRSFTVLCDPSHLLSVLEQIISLASSLTLDYLELSSGEELFFV